MFGCREQDDEVVLRLGELPAVDVQLDRQEAVLVDMNEVEFGNADVIDNEVELEATAGRQTFEDDDEITSLCRRLEAMSKHLKEMTKVPLPASFGEKQRENIVSKVAQH
jgi:hypothetical protein